MQVQALEIPEVKLIVPNIHRDERGFFSETFNARALAAWGIKDEFVQDNNSLSVQRGVVRGLHFQIPPNAQDKLIRVIRGSIFDVAVDIRSGSPTYGKHVCALLSAASWNQLWVPKGFAHGFCTLEPNTEVLGSVYLTKQVPRHMVSAETDAENETGVPRIEVTPEMIEAGVTELAGFYWDTEDSRDAARRVFDAMISKGRIAGRTL